MKKIMSLENKIMGRVYAIYLVRRATSPKVLVGVVGLLGIIEILLSVSVVHVLENIPLGDPSGLYTFFTSAVINTLHVVQVALVLVLASLTYYAISLSKRVEIGEKVRA